MTESKSGPRWVAALAGAAAIGVGAWLLLGDSREPRDGPETPAAREIAAPETAPSTDPAPPAASVPAGAGLRIATSGRLTLEADALPREGPLSLVLDLADDARGSGERTVRIVSADGRRVDTTAAALSGAGTGLQLDIDPAFLSKGSYMIEVDTVDEHPLRIRRYVLEIQ